MSGPESAHLPAPDSAPSVPYRDSPYGKTRNSSHKTSNKTHSTTCLDEIWQENSGMVAKPTMGNQLVAPMGSEALSWAKGSMASLNWKQGS